MREINIPLDSSKEKSKKLISAAALYGDKACVHVPIYNDGLKTKFHDQRLLDDISVLEREGIISLQHTDLSHISSRERNEMVSTIGNLDGYKKLYSKYDFLYKDASYSPSFVVGLISLEVELRQFDPTKKSEYIKKFLEINKALV